MDLAAGATYTLEGGHAPNDGLTLDASILIGQAR